MTTQVSKAQENPSLGVMLMIGFCICAPLLDVCAKLASETIPVGQVTTARFFFQAIIMLPIMWAMGFSFRFPLRLLRNLAFRALMLILSTYCFVAAIAVMPIADALAIAFVEPFILLVVGKYVFSESVGYRRLIACAVGFIGILLVIQPSFAAFGWVALFPLGTAVFFAFYMFVTRTLSRDMHAVQMQFHSSWIGTLMCAPVLIWANGSGIVPLDPVWPEGVFWFYLIGVGAGASLSHLLMSLALTYAPSSTLAPLHYLEIVSAVIMGFLVFGDIPNQLAFTGMIIVIASGLYIVFRERQIGASQ
jgi:drug/metabolite transporter (DMT)-like permease